MEKEKKIKKHFQIRLAGRIFEIEHNYDYVKEYCKNYLIEKGEVQPVISINVNASDILFERKKSEMEDLKEGRNIRRFSEEYLETLAVYRKITEVLLTFDTLLFHGSVIAVDGKGYLFAAKSGTGKSTHARLWKEHFGAQAEIINDDKPLLKITEKDVIACGTPWNGKHRLDTNKEVPLQGICILRRAVDNHIEIADRKEVYPVIVQQTYRSGITVENMKITLQLIDRMIQRVPVYKLECNMKPEAVVVAYNEMQKGRKSDEVERYIYNS